MKYAMIKSHKNDFPLRMMCCLLAVSRGGYYEWLDRPASNRSQADKALAEHINRIFDEEKGRAGAPRITRRLQNEGHTVSRNRVARIMKEQGLRAKAAKRYKATTNSNHNLPVAPNLLEQDFNADKPNQKWVSDITYIWTDEGWLYLAVVLDLYARRVIGWAMSDRMTSALVCDALTMALWKRQTAQNVIVHSDRGSQYCSVIAIATIACVVTFWRMFVVAQVSIHFRIE